MNKFLIMVITFTLLSGCSAWNWKYGEDKPSISFSRIDTPEKGKAIGTLWGLNPDDSGVYANEQGKACMIYAKVFKTKNSNLNIETKLAKYKDKLDGIDASLVKDITETVTSLTKPDESSTFANVMMFNICMLSANQALEKAAVSKLTSEVIAAGVAMSKNKKQ